MRKTFTIILATLASAVIAAPSLAPASTTHRTTAWWMEGDASSRLEIGRFATRRGIHNALCNGTGKVKRIYTVRHFRHFECKVYGKDFSNERQLVLHVTGETRFRAEWLTMAECG